MDITSQTRENRERENREYVRKLLRERQPDFAVVLESVVQEPRRGVSPAVSLPQTRA